MHVIDQLMKFKDEDKIFKAVRGKNTLYRGEQQHG